MESSDGAGKAEADLSRVPRGGLKLMIVILIGLALVALYANVQKLRRDKIERATITPVSTGTPAAAAPGR